MTECLKTQKKIMLRPRRRIVSNDFPYKVTNYSADKTRLVMRVLEPVSTLDEAERKRVLALPSNSIELLHSTLELATPNSAVNCRKVNFSFDIDGERYFIFLEGAFDKETSPIRTSFEPMGNIQFCVRRTEGIVRILDAQKESFISRFASAYQAQSQGYMTLGQVFCRDKRDFVNECAMSFATHPHGKIITKLRIDEEKTSADYVNGHLGASRYLNIIPRMTAPDHCKPNELITINVQFYQGNTENKINGVNWDGLIVEAVDGYVPHRRVKIRDGKGSFKVRALDLEDGDIMRIKLNTKWYTSKDECQIKIISNP